MAGSLPDRPINVRLPEWLHEAIEADMATQKRDKSFVVREILEAHYLDRKPAGREHTREPFVEAP